VPNYNYAKTSQRGPPSYDLLTITPTPDGFDDVHLTLPSDAPMMDDKGRITNQVVWKQPHVTFRQTNGRGQITVHCFIKLKGNKCRPFDGTGRERALSAE